MKKLPDQMDPIEAEFYKIFFNACPVPAFVFDIPSFQIEKANQRACDIYEYSNEEFLTMSVWDLRPPSEYAKVAKVVKDISADITMINRGVYIHKKKNGELIKMDITTQVIESGKGLKILALANEVTEEIRKHELNVLEREIVQVSLSDNIELSSIFKKYLAGVGKIIPGIMTSLLRVENGKLYGYISDNVPEEIIKAVEELEIGPEVAAFGAAAYSKKLVIANDIQKDPFWIPFRKLAKKYSLASALSFPVLHTSGNVQMIFTVYRDQVWFPEQEEIDFFTRIGNLIALLLEKQEKAKLMGMTIERYTYVTKATSDIIWDWDIQNNLVEWGAGYQRLFGVTEEEEIDRFAFWAASLHPEDKDRVLMAVEGYVKGSNNSWKQEYRLKKPDGSYAHVRDNGYLLRDDHGKPYRAIGAIQDITEQRNREINITRQQQLLERISAAFNSPEDIISTLKRVMKNLAEFGEFDAAETWLLVGGVLKLTAHISSNKKGDFFYQQSHDINQVEFGEGIPGLAWKERSMMVWKNLGQESQFLRSRVAFEAGFENCVALPLTYNGGVIGVLMLFGSVNTPLIEGFQPLLENMDSFIGTELKRKQSELELKVIFETVPDIILVTNKEGIISQVNTAGRKIMEAEESEIVGKSLFAFNHPSDDERAKQKFAELLEAGKTTYYEGKVVTPGGKIIRLASTFSYMPSEDSILVVCKDITRQSELQKLLDDATQLAKIGGWEWDLTKDVYSISPFTRAILEEDENFESTTANILNFCREEFKEMVIQKVKRAIRFGIPFDIEVPILTAAGNEKWLRLICEIDRENGFTKRIYGSVQDIHDRKKAELLLAQRSNFLSSIASINSIFLTSEDWFSSLSQAFELSGIAVQVDRIHFFEATHHSLSGEMILNESFEWVRGVERTRLFNPKLQEIWLNENETVFHAILNGSTQIFSTDEIADSQIGLLMKEQGIRSMLAIPMFITGRFLGFLGFEYFNKERQWSAAEISFLSSVTSNLAIAIHRRENQHALNEVLEQRSQILESIGDAFFAVNKNWKVSYWNKKAEDIFKLKKNRAMGQDLWVLSPELKGQVLVEKLKHAMDEQQAASVEYFSVPVGKWFEVNIYPSTSGLAIYFKDISERRYSEEQLQRSNERFEKAAKATNDAIWDWDIENNTQYWGDGFNALFGFETQQTEKNRSIWMENIHDDDRQAVIDSLTEVLDSDFEVNWHMEYRFRRSFGSYAYIDDRGVVIRNESGKPIRMVGAITDITYQKEYERSLRKLNSNLERQTRELTSSNAELEQFAYVASHDLQEPLRMVSSFLTKLSLKYEDLLDEKGKQYINFAVDGAQRMRQTILDLLQYSRVGKGNTQPEWIDMDMMMNSVCLLHKQSIEELEARIVWDKLPKIFSFQTPMLHIMNNLIGNALKYHRPSLPPLIHVRAMKKGELWQFEVEDNGLGIEKEYQQKVFVLFQRVHSQTTGSGIGLAVVRKIVESLDGKVWVESEPDKGSTFYFTIKEEKPGPDPVVQPN